MKRLIETALLNWKSNSDRKPLILYGARQVGKSYTLIKFGKENYADYVYCIFRLIQPIDPALSDQRIRKHPTTCS